MERLFLGVCLAHLLLDLVELLLMCLVRIDFRVENQSGIYGLVPIPGGHFRFRRRLRRTWWIQLAKPAVHVARIHFSEDLLGEFPRRGLGRASLQEGVLCSHLLRRQRLGLTVWRRKQLRSQSVIGKAIHLRPDLLLQDFLAHFVLHVVERLKEGFFEFGLLLRRTQGEDRLVSPYGCRAVVVQVRNVVLFEILVGEVFLRLGLEVLFGNDDIRSTDRQGFDELGQVVVVVRLEIPVGRGGGEPLLENGRRLPGHPTQATLLTLFLELFVNLLSGDLDGTCDVLSQLTDRVQVAQHRL